MTDKWAYPSTIVENTDWDLFPSFIHWAAGGLKVYLHTAITIQKVSKDSTSWFQSFVLFRLVKGREGGRNPVFCALACVCVCMGEEHPNLCFVCGWWGATFCTLSARSNFLVSNHHLATIPMYIICIKLYKQKYSEKEKTTNWSRYKIKK